MPVEIRDIFQCPTPAALAKHIQSLLGDETPKSTSPPNGSSTEISSATTSGSDTEAEACSPSNGSVTPASSTPEIPSHYVFSNMPNKPYVFCTPPALGIGMIFSALSMVSNDFNVVGVNDPALCDRSSIADETASRDFNDLAAGYYKKIVELEGQMCPSDDEANSRPLNVLGYSSGGNVAMEVARQAKQDGRRVNLFIVDSAGNEVAELVERYGVETVRPHIEKAIDVAVAHGLQENHLGPMTDRTDKDMHEALLEIAFARLKQNVRGFFEHTAARYPGHMIYFRSEGTVGPTLAGRAESVDEVRLPGSHYGLLESQGEAIVDKVSQVLVDFS